MTEEAQTPAVSDEEIAPEDTPSTAEVPDYHTPRPDGPPLPKETFDEHGPLDGEPHTDVKIVLHSNQLALRERMEDTARNADNTMAGDKASPTSRTISISNAYLDENDKVLHDENGKPRLATKHELTLTNEAMGRLGKDGLEREILAARQISAAKASLEAQGYEAFQDSLGDRTKPRDRTEPSAPKVVSFAETISAPVQKNTENTQEEKTDAVRQ